MRPTSLTSLPTSLQDRILRSTPGQSLGSLSSTSREHSARFGARARRLAALGGVLRDALPFVGQEEQRDLYRGPWKARAGWGVIVIGGEHFTVSVVVHAGNNRAAVTLEEPGQLYRVGPQDVHTLLVETIRVLRQHNLQIVPKDPATEAAAADA